MKSTMNPERITDRLIEDLESLRFKPPVTHVYNPLVYAAKSHRRYLERFGRGTREILLVGMNPGPWGMAQTGVPFGDVTRVREWMGIEERVGKPPAEHPKRPIRGFQCSRSEVSGTRLWCWAEETFGSPERFFDRFFVVNYCPLCFMEESGRNRTPDKLPVKEKTPIFEACDSAFKRLVEYYKPQYVIGVGSFAEKRALEALDGIDTVIARIPHPSPANPAANRGWSEAADRAFAEIGIRY